jgi:hypothetical protein
LPIGQCRGNGQSSQNELGKNSGLWSSKSRYNPWQPRKAKDFVGYIKSCAKPKVRPLCLLCCGDQEIWKKKGLAYYTYTCMPKLIFSLPLSPYVILKILFLSFV